MEIKSLEKTSFGTLFEAFGQAFADYEVQLDKTQLRRMLRRRGFDPRLSFAAFDGEWIAAFTLNGTGNFNGLPTAYDTGTGTLEAYRGKDLRTLHPLLAGGRNPAIPAGSPATQHKGGIGLPEARVRNGA